VVRTEAVRARRITFGTMTTSLPARCGLLGLALAIPPSQARGQRVQGASLGVTTVRQLIETRGEPADTGRNVGGWLFVGFGQGQPRYIYYFSRRTRLWNGRECS
jgi:hypothetical protein